MRSLFALPLMLSCLTMPAFADSEKEGQKNSDHECALDFEVKNIDGKEVNLEEYEGKVVLIVNVASECGLTGQYAGLQDLYEKYREKGLVVLGFPCNQFGRQEPGTEAEIKRFCSTNYNVTFPMFSKLEVNGEGADPLYKYLTAKEVQPKGKGKVSWNFEKFLIDREGQLVGRFAPPTRPSDKGMLDAIENELKKG